MGVSIDDTASDDPTPLDQPIQPQLNIPKWTCVVDSQMGGLVFPATWSSDDSCRIDQRRDGFEGSSAAHKPCDLDTALCERCAGKHAICHEFAGNSVQRMFNGGYHEAELTSLEL